MSAFCFDITKPATWNLASNHPFSWMDIDLYNANEEPITEKAMVDYFEAAFAFLEHKGDQLSYEKKQKAIKTLLDRMKVTNSKAGIEATKKLEKEQENSRGKTKILIKCNFIREDKKFDGKCWKCGSSIPSEFEGKYQCPSCGFITFHIDGEYMDEWEHWDLDEARVICSSAHSFINLLRNKLGEDYDRIEKSCSMLPEFSKINIGFSVLIDSINKSPHIDYQNLGLVYYDYSRFLFEHGAYFYEALYNAQLCNLLYLKEFGAKQVKVACRMPCKRECTDFLPCYIDEAIQHPIIPKRDALDSGFFDYDDSGQLISEGYVIGYCHAEYEENITSPLYDAAIAKLKRQQSAWGEAVAPAQWEYSKKGIENPDDTTPRNLDRINEIYHRLMGSNSSIKP